MGFYSDLMAFYSDLMEFYSDLMGYDLGKQTVCYWKWPIEIVDLPIKEGVFSIIMGQFTRRIWSG